MKIILKFALILYVMVLSTLYSCSSWSSDSIEGFNNYQEACEAHRFDVAYRFLAKISPYDVCNYNDAQDYILKKEIAYLISLGEEQHQNRVILLLKTEIRPEEKTRPSEKRYYYDKLIPYYTFTFDLAESFNNDDLKEKLIPLFKSVLTKKIIVDETCIEPVHNNVFQGYSRGDAYLSSDRYFVSDRKEEIQSLNNSCLIALDLAIKIGDETWANEIVNKMKPNVRIQIIKHNWEGDKDYTTLKLTCDDYEAINSAKQMLKDAKF